MVILLPLISIKPSCLKSLNVLINDSVAVPTILAKSVCRQSNLNFSLRSVLVNLKSSFCEALSSHITRLKELGKNKDTHFSL